MEPKIINALSPTDLSKTSKVFSVGCGGCAVLTVAFVVFMIWGAPYLIGRYIEHTAPVPGDAQAYKPFESLSEVRDYAGEGAVLREIDISFMKKDGTVDLKTKSYNANVDYNFDLPLAEAPENAPPIGAGASLEGEWVEPITIKVQRPLGRRSVRRVGGGVSTSYSYIHQGMERDSGTPRQTDKSEEVRLPTCSLPDLWMKATDNDPKLDDAVATVEINAIGITFRINGANVYRVFTPDCEVVK